MDFKDTNLKPKQRRGRLGSALLIVLWAIMVLAFSVMIISENLSQKMKDASIRAKRFQAGMFADSAVATLNQILINKHLLSTSLNAKSLHAFDGNLYSFSTFWTSEPVYFEGGSYWIEIIDEQSKINWLKTPSDVWKHIFEMANVPSAQVDAWFDALKDWQDNDDFRSLNGAETAEYLNLGTKLRIAKNDKIEDFGELFWVYGGSEILSLMLPDPLLGKSVPLLPMTTIQGDGKININSAPKILLVAAGLRSSDAEMIIKKRSGTDGIEGTNDDIFLYDLPEELKLNGQKLEDYPALTTSSGIFRVRGVGEYDNQRVVRESLAVKDGKFHLRLLKEARTVESYTIRKQVSK